MSRKIGQAGMQLIMQFEGCRLTAYKPVATEKYYTIGYGHYGADVTKGMKISMAQAEAYLIAAAVSSVAGKLNMEVVESLPVEGISTTTFYLLPKETAEEKNVYDEYINTDGTTSGWELIGGISTSIDLSNYYNKQETDALVAEKTTQIADDINKHLDTLEFGEVAGGKNLFDGKFINKVIEIGGNYTQRNLKEELGLINNVNGIIYTTFGGYFKKGTYTFSYTNDAWFSLNRIAIAGTNCIGVTQSIRKSYTWTQNVDGFTYFGIEGDDSETGLVDTPFSTTPDIMIEKGSTATTPYEPYIPSVKMLSADVDELKNDLSKQCKKDDITTNETLIGTFNGKNYYRRLFTGIGASGSSVTVNVGEKIEIYNYYGRAYTYGQSGASDVKYPIPNKNYYIDSQNASETSFQLTIPTSSDTRKVDLVIEYTKVDE